MRFAASGLVLLGLSILLLAGWLTVLRRDAPTQSPFIAYRGFIDRRPELFIVTANGSRHWQVTDNDTYEATFAWVVDGLLYSRTVRVGADQTTHLMYTDPAGHDQRDIAALTDPFAWTVALDGEQVIYRAAVDGALMHLNLTSDRATRINTPVTGAPFWSPTGEWLLVMDEGRVMLMRPDGSDLQELLADQAPWYGDVPRWSPDGHSLILTHTSDYAVHDFHVQIPAGTARNITRDLGLPSPVQWSGNGTGWLTFAQEDGHLHQVGRDGRRGRDYGILIDYPTWSADGVWLAYQASIGGDFEIVRRRSAGGAMQQLTHRTGADMDPRWSLPMERTLSAWSLLEVGVGVSVLGFLGLLRKCVP